MTIGYIAAYESILLFVLPAYHPRHGHLPANTSHRKCMDYLKLSLMRNNKMFIETWTAAHPMVGSAQISAVEERFVPQAGTSMSSVDKLDWDGWDEPNSGYSLISSKPIAVTSTLNA